MKVKVFDAVRVLPIEEVDLSEYCTVEQAALESGIPEAILWQHIHRSRRVGSAVVGNARLVKRADVGSIRKELRATPKPEASHATA